MSTWEERFPRLWAFGEQMAVIVLGGLMFWLFSALIITTPAAIVALFAAIASFIRPVSGEVFGRFWRGFRRSFLTALGLGLLDAVVGFILWFDIRFFLAMGTTLGTVAAFLFGAVASVVAVANMYAWPLLAWYPQPLGRLVKRSFLLAAAHPLPAIGAVFGSVAIVLLLMMLPGWAQAFLPLLGPGLVALLIGKLAWSSMRRYVEPDDEFAE